MQGTQAGKKSYGTEENENIEKRTNLKERKKLAGTKERKENKNRSKPYVINQ